MSQKTNNVSIVRYMDSDGNSRKIVLGNWTKQQKQDFITSVNKYVPCLFYFDCACSFNIHYDQSIIHVSPFDKPKTFIPLHPRDKKGQMIIEIIPNVNTAKCYPESPAVHCLGSIFCKNCSSNFIRDNLLTKVWYNHQTKR